MILRVAALTFASGALIEGLAALWVRHCEAGHRWRAGLASVLYGVVQIYGLGAAIGDPRSYAPFLLAGYFVGTFAVVGFQKKPRTQ